ncbi:MAG: hypothetical protein NWF00_00960 [Candidatus Bathyarchaeota archaeon]|nr:hypothetical protein [Candidatus Bathyarchaeota archaeon]
MTSKKAASVEKPFGVRLITVWLAVNIVMMTYMILTHQELNALIEILLWIPSAAGLWLMKKWGAAVTVTTLGITLGISLSELLLTYNSAAPVLTFVPINALRVTLNAAAIIYLFQAIFAGKFE